jgi:hypothetical protein
MSGSLKIDNYEMSNVTTEGLLPGLLMATNISIQPVQGKTNDSASIVLEHDTVSI